ncbi:MAG: uracil-DNA glycosylase [Terriglobales bacterium]
MGAEAIAAIRRQVTACRRCPRLAAYGVEVAATRRRAFADSVYWGRPVPGFGDANAHLLIVGLAPAAHGAHRTGRMFTGDRSGDFLFAALHRAGYANQAESRAAGDGLRLRGAYLTAAARCAPPGNLPRPEEFAACRPFLEAEIAALPRLRAVLTLGRLAHQQFLAAARSLGMAQRPAVFPFAHGAAYRLDNGWRLVACYHPSQQNTFTGRLTAAMLDAALKAVAAGRRGRPS